MWGPYFHHPDVLQGFWISSIWPSFVSQDQKFSHPWRAQLDLRKQSWPLRMNLLPKFSKSYWSCRFDNFLFQEITLFILRQLISFLPDEQQGEETKNMGWCHVGTIWFSTEVPIRNQPWFLPPLLQTSPAQVCQPHWITWALERGMFSKRYTVLCTKAQHYWP